MLADTQEFLVEPDAVGRPGQSSWKARKVFCRSARIRAMVSRYCRQRTLHIPAMKTGVSIASIQRLWEKSVVAAMVKGVPQSKICIIAKRGTAALRAEIPALIPVT